VRAEDLILISVDDHICEPADMFDGHVPQRWAEHTPRVVTDARGGHQWWYGDIMGRNIGLNAVAGKPRDRYNINPASYEEMRRGCWDVHERVRDMDAGGQLAGMNFPNWTGFSGQVLNEGPDPDVNEVMVKAYNDWAVLEWAGAYPDRFIPMGIVPYTDPERAAAEIHRLSGMGCAAINFPEAPDHLGLPALHSDHWHPVWQACSDTGTVVCMHIGAAGRRAMGPPGAAPSVSVSIIGITPAYTLNELVWSPIWHRFPDLTFCLSEGGIGWIPYMLQRMDHVHEQHGAWTRHTFPDGMRPSDIFRKHIVGCFITDEVGTELLHRLNVDMLCWESDYPHSDGCWPNGPEWVEKAMGHLPDDVVNRITHENPMRIFRFDPFRHRPRERCTAGALRAESPDVDVVTHVGHDVSDADTAAYAELGKAWGRNR